MTNAMKYAHGDSEGLSRICVSLRRVGDARAELKVENSTYRREARDEIETDPGTGLGNKLIAAFAQQLGGTVEREEDRGTFRVAVTFPIRPLSGAEERHAEAGAA